jgi:type II secretory pathway component PulF
MRNLIHAGEESGNLEAVLKRLGDHFALQRQIRNNFLVRLIYPGFQITAAILILAALAYFMTSLATEGATGSPEWAAMKVLISGFGTIAALIAAYYFVTRVLTERKMVQEVVLKVPVLGRVRRSMALANFSWSMELMLRAGTNIRDALRRSFESTSNGAFISRAPQVEQAIVAGATVTTALSDTRLFPDDFIEVISVAEESGNMDESFGRLAKLYYERTEVAMKAASIAFSVVIWICVAAFIIYNIFKLAMRYVVALQEAGKI